MLKEEKREQKRFSLSGKKKLEVMDLYEPHIMERGIEGEILNMSSGGFCVSINKASITNQLKKLDVVRLVIPVSKGLPGIPTLGEVRWIVSMDNGMKRSIIGIRFVI